MRRLLVTQAPIDTFERDGVVLIRALFADYVETIRAGIDRNLTEPGEHAAENLVAGEGGRFFDNYCNWTRISEFERVIRDSPAATRRHAFSLRLIGDNARYVKRPGPTSQPFPGHGMRPGDRLREDGFPVVHGA